MKKKEILLVNLHGKLGMFHYAYHFANALVGLSEAKNITVNVLLPSYSEGRFFVPEVKLHRVRASHSAIHFLWETFLPSNWFQVLKNIYRADTVHFLDNHPWLFWMLPLSTVFGKERIVTIHDLRPHSGESNALFRFLQKGVTRLSFQLASKIVIHSEQYRSEISERWQEKLVVVPHGIFNQLPEPSVKRARERDTILFFGRIREYKGLDVLVKAWQGVKHPQKKLLIAGEGEIESTIRQQIEKDRSIELRNEDIPDEEVALFFYRSSLLVLPYKNATQSGPLLLAYNYKLPVLATRVGSIPEYIEEQKTGWLVPANDSQALTEALENFYLLSSEAVEKMGEAAYQKATREYSWEAIVRKIYS